MMIKAIGFQESFDGPLGRGIYLTSSYHKVSGASQPWRVS
jgi:hypothetical protein